MLTAIDKLRELADGVGGVESSDGLFLHGLADAIEMGDAMDELNGKTLLRVDAHLIRHGLYRDGELYEVHGTRSNAVRSKKLYEPGSRHQWAIHTVLVNG